MKQEKAAIPTTQDTVVFISERTETLSGVYKIGKLKTTVVSVVTVASA